MIRRILALATLLVVLAGVGLGAWRRWPAAAPTTSRSRCRAGRPGHACPTGRVLPVRPDWIQESSVQAEMLAEHAQRSPTFDAGAQPRRLGEAGATAWPGSAAPRPIIPLTPGAPSEPGPVPASLNAGRSPNGMRKEVLGFLPYWLLDAGLAAVDAVPARHHHRLLRRRGPVRWHAATTSGGRHAGWSGWNSSAMTDVINAAHAQGVRVVLTVTMMAWDGGAAQAALLGNATARAALVNAIVATVSEPCGGRRQPGLRAGLRPRCATSTPASSASSRRALVAGRRRART